MPTAIALATAAASSPVLQSVPEFLTGSLLGKLLVALVVIALVLFVGRIVMNVAWKLLRIAIVVVALLWLLSVVVPTLGV